MPRNDSNGANNVTKLLVAASAAAVTAGAVYWFVIRKPNNAIDLKEDAAFSGSANKKSTSASSKPASNNKSAAATAGATTSTSSAGGMGTSSTSSSNGDLVTSNSFGGDALYREREESDGFALPGVPDEQGNVSFPHVYLKLKIEPRWTVNEEVAPVPTVALLSLQHEDFAGKNPQEQTMPGQVPIVMISCEDTAESSTLDEAKERAKNMGMKQLNMMGQGRFPPQLTKDSSADVGSFKRIVEIQQRTPHWELHVINYFGIKNGVVYSFQMLANAGLVSKYRHDFATMARNCELLDNPSFISTSYVITPLNKDKSGSFKVPSAWNISKGVNKIPTSVCPEESVLGVAQSASPKHPEYVVVTNAEPNTADLIKIESLSKTLVDGKVQFTEYKTKETHSPKHIRVLKNATENVWVLCGPVAAPNQVVRDVVLANVLLSVSTSTPASITNTSTAAGRYRSERFGFEFDVRKGGKIMEASIGEKVVMYAPLGGLEYSGEGQPSEAAMQAAQEQPIVTIRVGDPETDPDIKETLDEWAKNVRSKSAMHHFSNVRKETIGDTEFLTFENKEMVEVGEGRKEERMAKMFVCTLNRRSTMIRWESTTGVWRKYEGQMMDLIRSVKLITVNTGAAREIKRSLETTIGTIVLAADATNKSNSTDDELEVEA